MRQIILYPGEDGYWVVECPSLPTSAKQSRVTSLPYRKMVSQFLKNGLKLLSWLYDKPAAGLRTPVRRRTSEKRISIQASERKSHHPSA